MTSSDYNPLYNPRLASEKDANQVHTPKVFSYTPGGLMTVSASFTRPADTTAYAQYDLVANSTSAATPVTIAGAVRAEGDCIRIERLRLRKSGASLTNAQFRVHLFRSSPALSVHDNAAFNSSGALGVADIAGHVGAFDITMDVAGTAGASGKGVPTIGNSITTSPASGTDLYALIEARAGYTPASGEVFTLTIEGQWA